jgi:hypothetical protein
VCLQELCTAASSIAQYRTYQILGPSAICEELLQGGYERLRLAEFPDEQPTKDCIVKTMKRIAVRSLVEPLSDTSQVGTAGSLGSKHSTATPRHILLLL